MGTLVEPNIYCDIFVGVVLRHILGISSHSLALCCPIKCVDSEFNLILNRVIYKCESLLNEVERVVKALTRFLVEILGIQFSVNVTSEKIFVFIPHEEVLFKIA